ncbi:MAG: RadC family protein [Clostridia bacterium]|nr:RadC family protein [Clostridia bacterium]
MAKSIHDGHRERLRNEIMNHGIDENTPPHKILEFLLFYCIARKDTNPIAHALIDRFGSLFGVLEAPVEEIAQINGMNVRSAMLIKSILPIARVALNNKTKELPTFGGIDEIGEYAVSRYIGIEVERAGIISLDGKGKLLGFDFLSNGDISSVGLSVRDVVNILIKHNAVAAVLIHNHPSGIALPSSNDREITENLANALGAVGIYLVDHIIVGFGDFVSMAQSKDYAYIFSK